MEDMSTRILELNWFSPGEAMLVIFIPAIVPHLALRGPVNRLTPSRKQEGNHE
jgi:hypothetical protein